jgi:transposase
LGARREDLLAWSEDLPRPWLVAMEATLFTGWVYDALLPIADGIKVANPLRMRGIWEAKKKNDRADARMLADALRADLLPECWMAPGWIRELRRVMRYRNFLVNHATSLKNKTAGLLMECGVEYEKGRLHTRRYFDDLLGSLTDVPNSVVEMARINRGLMTSLTQTHRQLLCQLRSHPRLVERLELLKTIPSVGDVVALTWALEVGDPERFSSIRKAVSYCGLCSAQKESAGKTRRGPISKQRNKHLQWVLVQAAKQGPRFNETLRSIYEKECERGARNRASLAVARKIVAWLLAVDKSQQPWEDPRTCMS